MIYRAGHRAFSMFELIAVMVLLSLLMAMAAPSLSRFFHGRMHHDAASTMLTMLRLARVKAVADGRAYRFNLDPQRGWCWLTAQEAGAFTELGDDEGKRYELPAGVSAEWVEPLAAVESGHITFTPTGEIEPAVIRVKSNEDTELHVRADSPTDSFRVSDPLQEQPSDPVQAAASGSTSPSKPASGASGASSTPQPPRSPEQPY
jgi:prepilin-type N-terminal cleavage/methylation domain-containing protein